jgi:hypothetical protein
MSLIDAKHLKNKQLIIQYLVEQRQSGHSLPYDDYITINLWMKASPSSDHLLMILSDLVPTYYAKSRAKFNRPISLNGLKNKVLKELSLLNIERPQSGINQESGQWNR